MGCPLSQVCPPPDPSCPLPIGGSCSSDPKWPWQTKAITVSCAGLRRGPRVGESQRPLTGCFIRHHLCITVVQIMGQTQENSGYSPCPPGSIAIWLFGCCGSNDSPFHHRPRTTQSPVISYLDTTYQGCPGAGSSFRGGLSYAWRGMESHPGPSPHR